VTTKYARAPWGAMKLTGRPQHHLEFPSGILDEIHEWITRCPEVVDEDVDEKAVETMANLRILADQHRSLG